MGHGVHPGMMIMVELARCKQIITHDGDRRWSGGRAALARRLFWLAATVGEKPTSEPLVATWRQAARWSAAAESPRVAESRLFQGLGRLCGGPLHGQVHV